MRNVNNCPFCNSDKIKMSGFHSVLSSKSEIYIECVSCGARGPVIQYEHHNGITDNHRMSAVYWWNRAVNIYTE